MNYRFLWRCLLTGSVLALSLGMPMVDNPLTLPTAYAHHGGGGSSGGSGGGGLAEAAALAECQRAGADCRVAPAECNR